MIVLDMQQIDIEWQTCLRIDPDCKIVNLVRAMEPLRLPAHDLLEAQILGVAFRVYFDYGAALADRSGIVKANES